LLEKETITAFNLSDYILTRRSNKGRKPLCYWKGDGKEMG